MRYTSPMHEAHVSRLSIDALYKKFDTSRHGIPANEVAYRIARDGKNVGSRRDSFSLVATFLRALTAPFPLILVVCSFVMMYVHAAVDAFVILLTVSIHVCISMFEDRKAAKTFEHMRSLESHLAVVIRDGVETTITADTVVPGDLILLAGGGRIPADARLIESHELTVSESAITGEWAPVVKTHKDMSVDLPPERQSNMVWQGTFVSTGTGVAVVVATGEKSLMNAAIAKGAAREGETPLAKELRRISVVIIAAVSIVSMILYMVGVAFGESMISMLLVSVAVAVSAIPAGLPAMLTIVLATTMRIIASKGGRLKSIFSTETCGSVTFLLSDKTGTLTTGDMRLTDVVTIGGVEPETALQHGLEALRHAIYASDAVVEWEGNTPLPRGRPIEQALVAAGIVHAIDQRTFSKDGYERIQLVQFEPTRRYAISLNNDPIDQSRIYISGSPEHIVSLCSYIRQGGATSPMTSGHSSFLRQQLTRAAKEGKRAIAIAYRPARDKHISEDVLTPDGSPIGMIFSGIMLFGDSVRPDAAASIAEAQRLGVRVVMVTGDHADVARIVGASIGLCSEHDPVMLGEEIDALTDHELLIRLHSMSVFARLLPVHKIRIAHVLQDGGEVVAMTGDGINDAGALVAADVGVVPETATDLAKDASDLVLAESRIATILDAITEGRRAFYNMRRVLVYLLSTGLSEVLLIAASLVFRLPVPLSATQILWANMIQEGCMTAAFARYREQTDRIPPGPAHTLVPRRVWFFIATVSVSAGVLLSLVYVLTTALSFSSEAASGTLFVTLSLLTLFVSFGTIDIRTSLFHTRFSVHFLLGALLSVAALVLGSTLPYLREVTHGNATPFIGWAIGIGSGISALCLIECYKFLFRKTGEW